MKYKNLNLKYAVVNAAYLMLLCATAGYAYNFLTKNGFDSGTVGIIIAMISVCGIIGQTVFGSIIDKSERLDEKMFISISMCLTALLAAFLMLAPGKSILMVVLVVICFTSAAIGMPFLNYMAFIYEKDGQSINYGLGRGVGSAAYAVGSAVLGQLWGRFGKGILPIYILVLAVITFVLIRFMPSPDMALEEKVQHEQAAEKKAGLSYVQFFRKYSFLIIPAVSMILLYFCHMIVNTFAAEVIGKIIGAEAAAVDGAVESVQGTALFIQAMAELPTMFLFSLILKKIDINKILVFAAIAYSIKHILILLCPNTLMLYAAMILQMFSYAVLVPGAVYYANQNVAEEDRNKGQAIFGATVTVGGLLASLLGGQLLNITSITVVLIIGVVASLIGTALMILALGKDMFPKKPAAPAEAAPVIPEEPAVPAAAEEPAAPELPPLEEPELILPGEDSPEKPADPE